MEEAGRILPETGVPGCLYLSVFLQLDLLNSGMSMGNYGNVRIILFGPSSVPENLAYT